MSLARVRQAAVLAGGYGRRMLPLTASLPKPMIPVAGAPFAERLLGWLRGWGVERVLLLGGWHAEALVSHFGDGSRLGMELEYSISSPTTETALRLRRAASMLDRQFLVLYGDNFCPVDLKQAEAAWLASHLPAQMTVYDNRDGYSRANVACDEHGLVREYDAARNAAGLTGVDIGYLFLDRHALELAGDNNLSLSQALYPELVRRRMLGAFLTRHRYYGPAHPRRLAETERFFSQPRTVLLDRDGVLNRKPPRAAYVCSWSDWEWLPGALEALHAFCAAGWRVLVASNQAGVARGALTAGDLEALHARMLAEVEQAGGRIDGVYVCPHGWDEGCDCRKPSPGMLFQAQRDWTLDLSQTWYLGDDDRDAEAASRAGCRFLRISEALPLLAAAARLLAGEYGPAGLGSLAAALPVRDKEPLWQNVF
ncbi:MAG: HAD-IIIA family hydrolase [Acidobacteria bacterium]|nr:HAD-IIIA family hydrolase [Acidobacteriota bacterium]